jgi:mannosyl-oligosaccharide glucosidase
VTKRDGKNEPSAMWDEITGKELGDKLEHASTRFDKRFEDIFKLSTKGYDAEHVKFAKAMMSNLIGGIGYFHGNAIVDRGLEGFDSDTPIDFVEEEEDDEEDDYFSEDTDGKTNRPKAEPKQEGPFTLFTGTPSRPFFPRG